MKTEALGGDRAKDSGPNTDVRATPSAGDSTNRLDSPTCLRLASIACLALFAVRVSWVWAAGGLFYARGVDYAIFGATARVVEDSGWARFYDKAALTREFARWLPHGLPPTDPPFFVASPYPAPVALPFFATNLLGHRGGFAAWTAFNLLLYAAIVRGLVRGSERRGPIMDLAPFVFLPFLYNLYLGQMAIIMTFGLYRSYRGFQDGREFAAGCWLSLCS